MTKRRTFLLAGVVALAVVVAVHFLDFPGSVPRFEKVSGGGILLDAVPSFTAESTYRRLAEYGEAGRRSYAFRNLSIDLLLPLGVTVIKRAASLLAMVVPLLIFAIFAARFRRSTHAAPI